MKSRVISSLGELEINSNKHFSLLRRIYWLQAPHLNSISICTELCKSKMTFMPFLNIFWQRMYFQSELQLVRRKWAWSEYQNANKKELIKAWLTFRRNLSSSLVVSSNSQISLVALNFTTLKQILGKMGHLWDSLE